MRQLVDCLLPITAIKMKAITPQSIEVNRDGNTLTCILPRSVLPATYSAVRKLTLEIGMDDSAKKVSCAAIHGVLCRHGIASVLQSLSVIRLRTPAISAVSIEDGFAHNLKHMQLCFANMQASALFKNKISQVSSLSVALCGGFRDSQAHDRLPQVFCPIPDSGMGFSGHCRAYAHDCCTAHCENGCCSDVSLVMKEQMPSNVRSEVWSQISGYMEALRVASMHELEEEEDDNDNDDGDWNNGMFSISYTLRAAK